MRTTPKTLIALVASALLVSMLGAIPAAGATELAPVEGYNRLVALEQGDTGAAVTLLQAKLADLGFYHDAMSGEYDEKTAYAVRAFHAYLGMAPTYDFTALDWIRLDSLPVDPGIPNRWDEPDRVEVDIGRQLLFVVRDGEVAGILPVSTGGGYVYPSDFFKRDKLAWTPRGDYTLNWHQTGWSCLPACVYKYWGFTAIYGIHGYRSVPNYPASHGCVRITLWDARWVEPLLFVGMPIHVWDTMPELGLPPTPLRARILTETAS